MIYLLTGRVGTGKSFLLAHASSHLIARDYTNENIEDYSVIKDDIKMFNTLVVRPSQINRIAQACPDEVFHLITLVADPDDRKLNSMRDEDDFNKADKIEKDLYDKLEKCHNDRNYNEFQSNIYAFHVHYNDFSKNFFNEIDSVIGYADYVKTMNDIVRLALDENILYRNENKEEKEKIITVFREDNDKPDHVTVDQFASTLICDKEGFNAILTQLLFGSKRLKSAIADIVSDIDTD